MTPQTWAHVLQLSDPLAVARFVATQEELRAAADGLNGYGRTRRGDRVLLVTDSHYDPRVAEVLSTVLRERGAIVEQLCLDAGPDREFREDDELDAQMRRVSWHERPRRYEGVHWVEQLAAARGHDLVIMGRGGPGPIWNTPFRYENVPWFDLDQLCSKATVFPRDVNKLINMKLHETLMDKGRGARLTLTDPEGTDVSWTIAEEYYGSDYLWARDLPIWGHVMAHPVPPLVPQADAEGVISGTLNHFSRPFPRVSAHIEQGRLARVDGGGAYGDGWRKMLAETENIKYPGFPRPGLFWLFEIAIGTNPKIGPERPERMRYLSSGGMEKERHRSGAIHVGIGSQWRDATEEWAMDNGILNGHLHIHQFFSTLTLAASSGERFPLIEQGHLTALDDPEVRSLAARYGDPDEVLREDWIPAVPGITTDGDYEADYAAHPADFIYSGFRDAAYWAGGAAARR